jgi:hypothetical protein
MYLPQYILSYPIKRGTMINLVAFHVRPDCENTYFNGPWVSVGEREEMVSPFLHWEPEVQVLLSVSRRACQRLQISTKLWLKVRRQTDSMGCAHRETAAGFHVGTSSSDWGRGESTHSIVAELCPNKIEGTCHDSSSRIRCRPSHRSASMSPLPSSAHMLNQESCF